MKVNVKMNKSALKTLSEAQARAASMTGLEIINQVTNAGKIPFDTGNMQNETTFLDDSKVKRGTVTCVTNAKQARRLYYHPEYNFQKGKNANAGAGWWDDYLPTGALSKEPMKLFDSFYSRLAGRYVK